MNPAPPDYFDLCSDVVAAHAITAGNPADGTVTVNGDALADDFASRIEALAIALRLILNSAPLDKPLVDGAIAALVAAERRP